MPAMKRIKCAGEADEDLIADLENQLEEQAVAEPEYEREYSRASTEYQRSPSPAEYYQDDLELVDEEEPLFLYILVGILAGVVLIWLYNGGMQTPPTLAERDAEAAAETPPAMNEDGTPQAPKEFALSPQGLTHVKHKSTLEKITDFANSDAALVGMGACAVGAIAYKKGYLNNAIDKVKGVVQKIPGVKKVVPAPTAAQCRAQKKVLDPTGQRCVDPTWTQNFQAKLEDTADTVADTNAHYVNKAGHQLGVRNATGYLGKMGTLAGSCVLAVGCAVGLKYAWDYFHPTEKDSKKSNSKAGKADTKSGCFDLSGSDKKDKKKKKKGEEDDSYLYWIVGLVVIALVMALPSISAALGLEGYLGVVTGPISIGQNYVLSLVGMGGSSIPLPNGLAK